jgi:opacity protein-like surface antigen
VKALKVFIVTLLAFVSSASFAQELDKSATVSLFTGTINYQGDLNPNSFYFKHSNLAAGLIFRKPLNRWFTVRAGLNTGKIEAADSWNRDDLKSRNLSFTTTIKEVYAGLEVAILDISTKKFTPYFYAGIAVFHFNPWTRDNAGVKTYLKPLSTEGQGLAEYPDKKPYNLTQIALPFGAGLKYVVTDGFSIGVEFSQRKSFTDYIDDVSSSYVDRDVLLQAKGAKAVELAYRGGQSPLGSPLYPAHGEQRGTPSEMDWYYFVGLTTEIKLNSIGSLFGNSKTVASQRCPRF